MSNLELKIERLKEKFGLSSIHIFCDDSFPFSFRAFGSKRTVEGFQRSVTEGIGESIYDAIEDLWENLRVGPIKAMERLTAAKASRASSP